MGATRRRPGARAARGTFTSGLALLLATLGVLATTTTVADAQPRTRGRVIIETHHTDLAGNLRLSTNEAGDVTQRLDYAPFGEVDGRPCTGDGDPTRSPQFQGTLRDPKTCLDDFGARDYYMVTGRFQSVDPVLPLETALRDPQQWNRNAYARNNPLIYTDPGGRNPALLIPFVVGTFEGLSSTYDAYEAKRVFSDPNSTTTDKAIVAAQLAAGAEVPGSGVLWGKFARAELDLLLAAGTLIRQADDAVQFHHPWPKYLGGAVQQNLEPLPVAVHNAYHKGLDEVAGRWKGSQHYAELSKAELASMLQQLAAYTKDCDRKHGTHLYDALVREGFLQ